MKLTIFLILVATAGAQQSLDPAKLLKPTTDTWPVYHGDYTGRRYSTLAKINSTNINALSLAWSYRTGAGGIKATPLQINGVPQPYSSSIGAHREASSAELGDRLLHLSTGKAQPLGPFTDGDRVALQVDVQQVGSGEVGHQNRHHDLDL